MIKPRMQNHLNWQILYNIMTKLSSKKQNNNTNMQSSSRSAEFWNGFNLACDLLEDLGYTKTSSHPYNIADCLKAKMNKLPKSKIRKKG